MGPFLLSRVWVEIYMLEGIVLLFGPKSQTLDPMVGHTENFPERLVSVRLSLSEATNSPDARQDPSLQCEEDLMLR